MATEKCSLAHTLTSNVFIHAYKKELSHFIGIRSQQTQGLQHDTCKYYAHNIDFPSHFKLHTPTYHKNHSITKLPFTLLVYDILLLESVVNPSVILSLSNMNISTSGSSSGKGVCGGQSLIAVSSS